MWKMEVETEAVTRHLYKLLKSLDSCAEMLFSIFHKTFALTLTPSTFQLSLSSLQNARPNVQCSSVNCDLQVFYLESEGHTFSSEHSNFSEYARVIFDKQIHLSVVFFSACQYVSAFQSWHL